MTPSPFSNDPGVISNGAVKVGALDNRLSHVRPYGQVSYGLEQEHAEAFYSPFWGFRLPHVTIRHTLHLRFIHHHRCNLTAVAAQITTNTETTAIAAVTPVLKGFEFTVLFVPDGSTFPEPIVKVIVGGAELLGRGKVETGPLIE